MPLAAHCHSLRPDKTSGWLAFFELGENGPRAGQFLVVGPELVDRADDVQAALRAGQAAVRYLKDVPGHAPPVTLLEATSRILLHESAKTQTSLEFGCAVLEDDALWFMSRGGVRLVPLGDDAQHTFASERPHAVSVNPGDRFFLGRLPGGGEDLDPDVRRRLEHASGGDGGLILQMVKREDIPNVPGRRPAPAPKRDDRQLEFETVIHELQLEFPKESEFGSPASPSDPAPQETPAPAAPVPEATEAAAPPETASEPEPRQPAAPDVEAPGDEGMEAPGHAETAPEPEPVSETEQTEPEPNPETEPEPEVSREPESRPALDPSPDPEPVGAHAYEPGDPHDAPPYTDDLNPVPSGLLPAAGETSQTFAPEETRGLGFWISIVAAGVALGALASYLFLIRPQMQRAGDRAGGVEPVVKASVVPDSLPRGVVQETVWEDQFTQAVTSTPVVAEDKVIFGCRDGRVYALSRADGRRVWAYAAADGFGSSPARAGETIVIGGYDGRIYALDIHSGEERWSVETKGRIVASPTVDDGTAYVGSYDHNLYAVSVHDGRVRWTHDLDAVLWSSPVCRDGMVWVAGLDGRVTALSGDRGKVLWQVETGAPIYSTPAVGESRVFVGSQDGSVYAFDRATGDLAWKTPAGSGEVNGSPAVQEGRVVIGTDAGTVLAMDAETGKVLWTVATGGQVKSRPAFLGPRVWVTGYDGLLHGIDWKNGSETAVIRTESSAYSSPTIDENVAFFGALDGRFFAIRLQS